jgi:nucleoside-diphosphate-sugar epimerase
MKILMTGHDGYIGSVMKPMLEEAGHSVVGVDAKYFSDILCPQFVGTDIRDTYLPSGYYDAVIHLAALSNDPMGEINKDLTFDINYKATDRLAELACISGVKRFLFSSSCSVYGMSDGIADEQSELHPLTAYAISKARAEKGLLEFSTADFSPVMLRNATAFGWSPNFRSDLVLNTMTCAAYTQNHVNIVGDGKQWRPLVHVQDICQAFLLALEAPKEKIHNQIFNIGARNYQVRAIAEAVAESFPSCIVTNSENKDIDPRSYQVDFTKAYKELGFRPSWSMWDGIEELQNMFDHLQLTDFSSYVRLAKLKSLMESRRLDKDLRWATKTF